MLDMVTDTAKGSNTSSTSKGGRREGDVDSGEESFG